MALYARINPENGLVAEPPVEFAEPPEPFHPDLVWVEIAGDLAGAVGEGWAYAEGAFSPPPPPPDQAAIALQAGRARRDRDLARSDWTQLSDAPLDTARREAWRGWRAAMRALPEQPGFPECDWPAPPAAEPP